MRYAARRENQRDIAGCRSIRQVLYKFGERTTLSTLLNRLRTAHIVRVELINNVPVAAFGRW
jgi:hypothetical protein